ncbi:hypothetical protein [Microbacterium sp. NPDC056736]|uniref:hypothetical protein n=1 Tax=Microbacterium sp. NPDC056736 TaxID=3345932 RepID=UPI0036736100
MTQRPKILASAQAQFPTGANKQVRVAFAWHPSKSSLSAPASNGDDGWDAVHEFATFEVINALASRGYTHVNLQTGGVTNPFRDVAISTLLNG